MFALVVFWGVLLVVVLEVVLASASADSAVAASVPASTAASSATPLISLLQMATYLNSRAEDVLLLSAVGFVRKVATTQASSCDRYAAEVSTSFGLLLEGRYFFKGPSVGWEFKWRSIELGRDMCLDCSVRMAPSIF